jgi:hypothetical protein
MLVTVDEAVGNKERGLEAMQCRAVPLMLVPMSAPVGLALPPQQQAVGYIAASCVGPKCMHWCWLDDNKTPAVERRGFCGLSGFGP